jgi:HlyD family secretion protein
VKKKIVIGCAIAAVIAGVLFFTLRSGGNDVGFRTERVTTGDIRATVTATGTVNAVTNVLVGTQVSGTIKRLFVDFNSKVKKGQTIAEIDPTTLEAQADQARANVLVAKANVAKARATLVDSQRTMERNRQLLGKDLIAKSDSDTAETNYESNKAQLAAAEAQVAQTEAALRFSQTNLNYTKIVSPVDGVVVSRNVDVGQTVAASFQTPTLFTIAQDLTKMQIDTNVDEADIGRIKVGQKVDFSVDAYPNTTLVGDVEQVRIAPITVQNVVTYDVVIKVDNTDLKLKPGMTANVSIIVAKKAGVLRIPNAALRFKPPEKDSKRPAAPPEKESKRAAAGPKGYNVWIMADGKPKQIPVTIGISDGIFTEVASGELREGQEIIVESLAKDAKKTNGQQANPPRFPR